MKSISNKLLDTKLLVLAIAIMVCIAGYYSYRQLPVDAFPDVSPNLVQVFTETEGLAPQEVEKFVTYPVEVSMNGMPGLKSIRSISNFGLSVVNIYFEDDVDLYFARQLVNERLQLAREEIPEGFGDPVMGPTSTGLGQILFFLVEDETGKKTQEEMREIMDWMIKFNLQTVNGVTEVLSLGGQVKQFQVQIKPDDLLRFDLTVDDILSAVRDNNSNAGAQFIVKNSEEYIVRSVGLAKDIDDLKEIILKVDDGTPIHLHQVADIKIGGEIRRGLATYDGKGEVVVGMVLKLIGTNTSNVISEVKEKMKEINKILPAGIKIIPYYDQSTLVARCVATVTSSLFQGIILVIIVLFLFMGGVRPSIIVAAAIPFSLMFAFILMKYLNISANLMSLGGLAIAIGMMVDGTIVMVENIDRYLNLKDKTSNKKTSIVLAFNEVARPIIFAIGIIILVFIPLFALQGVEGKTFKPLAQTVSLAMLGSLIFALFITPVLSSLIMKRKKEGAPEDVFLVRKLKSIYKPIVTFFVKKRIAAIGLGLGILILGAIIFPRLGSEFVPKLNEGDLLIRGAMAPSISLDEAGKTMTLFEKYLMKNFPEVTRVVTRVGRGEIGAHADPVNSAEAFVGLKPIDEWTSAKTPDELYQKISEKLESFPSAKFNVTQPIAAAVDELLTGTKAELAIKLFGEDMEVLKEKGAEIERVIQNVKGAADVQKDQVSGKPQLLISIDHQRLSRYGLSVADVQNTVSISVGGAKAGQIFEGVKRFDIYLRLVEGARNNLEVISNILIPVNEELNIPLSEIADIKEIVGPRQITREQNQRFITVQCNVRGRDMGSFVADAQKALEANVKLPPGYLITWGGQFELQQEANKRLMVVIPLTLLLVFLLLYLSFNSLKNSILILLNIPLALVGGVIGLWITGQNLSVPATVGFIALFGIALENGMVLITYLNQLVNEGENFDDASINGSLLRLRPVLMTAMTTGLGLIPLLLSSGTGSEVQRPLATVVMGGLFTSTVLTLLVIPALYKWFATRLPKEKVADKGGFEK